MVFGTLFKKKAPASVADPFEITTRTQLLNHLASRGGYRRYLEIGVRNPKDNFEHVQVAVKEGVDPQARCTFQMPSDDLFRQLDATPGRAPYDLVFIDGLHIADQVERDVESSLRHLSDGGCIVLHDCNPLTEAAQIETYIPGAHWNGTVWKAWAKLRATRPDLVMWMIDIDEGCGVIRRGSQTCFSPWSARDYDAVTYDYLVANRRELLNVVSVAEFLALDARAGQSRSAAQPIAR